MPVVLKWNYCLLGFVSKGNKEAMKENGDRNKSPDQLILIGSSDAQAFPSVELCALLAIATFRIDIIRLG